MGTRKAGVALACALALTAAAAQAAQAATLTIVSGKIIFTAAPGEFNDVYIEQGATKARITDTGVPSITQGTGAASPTCAKVAGQPNVLDCSRSGVTSYAVNVADLDDNVTMFGTTLPATLTGGTGNDVLLGGNEPDTINLGPGDSVQNALGGGGIDTIDATQAVAGLIDGGPGNDILKGTNVPSASGFAFPAVTVNGDVGNDTLTGGAGGNILNGGADTDTLTGGNGNDGLDGGPGPDSMTGGGGIDGVTYASRAGRVSATIGSAAANDDGEGCPPVGAACEGDNIGGDIEEVLGGSANDNLVGTAGVNLLVGNMGADQMNGGAGDDILCGDTGNFTPIGPGIFPSACTPFFGGAPPGGNDVMIGGTGNDILDGGGGQDDFRGDDGTDAAVFQRTGAVRVSLDDVVPAGAVGNDGEGCPPVGSSCEGDNVRSTIENVQGGGGNDSLVGSAAGNILAGMGGADVISGGLGNDLLCGNALNFGGLTQPADAAAAGSGFPFGFVSAPTCSASFGASGDGADDMRGGDGDDILDGEEAGDAISGGNGTDTTTYTNKTMGGVRVTLDNVANDGLGCTVAAPATCEHDNVGKVPGGASTAAPDVENLVGSQDNDELLGSTSLVLANVFNGGPGNDRLQPGAGNDMIIGGPGADVFVGGAGFDYADYRLAQSFGFGVTATMGDGLANDGLSCGPGQGVCEADNIGGPPIGSSTAAKDVEGFVGTPLNDDVTGTAAANTLLGRFGSDSLRGSTGNDFLSGDGSFDTLVDGGAGSDRLIIRDLINGETATCGEDAGGADVDVATIDSGDTAGADCEQKPAGVAALRMPRVADPHSAAFRALSRSARVTERLARQTPKRHRHGRRKH